MPLYIWIDSFRSNFHSPEKKCRMLQKLITLLLISFKRFSLSSDNESFRAVVLNVWYLATHKTEYYTIWRPIYYNYITKTTQKWVATQLLRNTDLEQCFSTVGPPLDFQLLDCLNWIFQRPWLPGRLEFKLS